ncbi:hypothetical protein BB561_000295 [Smittium simulii]|uniref:Branched-chain-amino-acid aminotransferase n=1 Tax=Smittium simulii TaxID=133385 RepID=A0A2T9YZR0_9FUNG|nr:hypothetical protein BB561_000295 [Smittium simulii]
MFSILKSSLPAARMAPSLFSTLSAKAAYSTINKNTFHFKDLKTTKCTKPKQSIPKEKLVFGTSFSDHMLEIKWSESKGWETPNIVPFHNFDLHPAVPALHYASQCFEGSKAYRGNDGKVRVFRLDKNMERMNNSVIALGLPQFDIQEAVKCIEELVKVDKSAIPEGVGYSMYLRPAVIGTEPALGVRPSKEALLYVICSPCGPYFPTGFQAVRLYADTDHVRAWPGGSGASKLGSNYAGGMYPQKLAALKGYQQILWLFGENHQISEAGTMNAFIFWVNEQGVLELLTPELDGTILPGITRDSILSITRKWGEFQVTEGKITMDQVALASQEGRLREVFGAGTACVISPVKEIGFMGSDIHIPLDPNDPTAQSGPLAKRLYNDLMAIQYGDISHEWTTILE